MTNEEMDRAIAEFLGPEYVEEGHRYTHDLEGMWHAEQTLWRRDWEARDVFIDRLCRILDPLNGHQRQSAIDILDATAAQRAQAFIETIRINGIRQGNIEREMRDTIKETVRE